MTFINSDGTRQTHTAAVGRTIMDCALDNRVAGIRGQCGGAATCGTCHCYVLSAWRELIPPASGDEADLLPLLFGPRADSRLACQITLTDALDGITVALPERQI